MDNVSHPSNNCGQMLSSSDFTSGTGCFKELTSVNSKVQSNLSKADTLGAAKEWCPKCRVMWLDHDVMSAYRRCLPTRCIDLREVFVSEGSTVLANIATISINIHLLDRIIYPLISKVQILNLACELLLLLHFHLWKLRLPN